MWGAQDRLNERAVVLVFRVNSARQLQPGTRHHKKLPSDFNCSNTFFIHDGYTISSNFLGTIFNAGWTQQAGRSFSVSATHNQG